MKATRLVGPGVVVAFGAFAVALALAVRPSAPATEPATDTGAAGAASGRTPLEERAVTAAAGAGLRPAEDDDAADSDVREDLRKLYGDYRPFFVRGDFDGDGRLDFAQAFVRRDGPEPLFDVAVFFGTPQGFGAPSWVERGVLLSGGDLSVDRSVLVVTEDVEQDASRRWRWEPSTRRFVDVDEATSDDDAEPEPDGRLRTTA